MKRWPASVRKSTSRSISITRSAVIDNGRGIPTAMHESGKSAAEGCADGPARRRQVREQQRTRFQAACTASASRSSMRCPKSLKSRSGDRRPALRTSRVFRAGPAARQAQRRLARRQQSARHQGALQARRADFRAPSAALEAARGSSCMSRSKAYLFERGRPSRWTLRSFADRPRRRYASHYEAVHASRSRRPEQDYLAREIHQRETRRSITARVGKIDARRRSWLVEWAVSWLAEEMTAFVQQLLQHDSDAGRRHAPEAGFRAALTRTLKDLRRTASDKDLKRRQGSSAPTISMGQSAAMIISVFIREPEFRGPEQKPSSMSAEVGAHRRSDRCNDAFDALARRRTPSHRQ